ADARFPAAPAESCPQRFVAAHDVTERLPESGRIKRSLEAECEGQVEQGQPRQVLLDPYHLVLRDRERRRPVFGQSCMSQIRKTGGRLQWVRRHGLVNPTGKLLDRRRL